MARRLAGGGRLVAEPGDRDRHAERLDNLLSCFRASVWTTMQVSQRAVTRLGGMIIARRRRPEDDA
jgi:hypothetical protein